MLVLTVPGCWFTYCGPLSVWVGALPAGIDAVRGRWLLICGEGSLCPDGRRSLPKEPEKLCGFPDTPPWLPTLSDRELEGILLMLTVLEGIPLMLTVPGCCFADCGALPDWAGDLPAGIDAVRGR